MKAFFKLILLSALIVFSSDVKSQDSCIVLTSKLQGTYTGDCKKGLAHGEGTAIGIDTYMGEWKKGVPHGFGKYIWSTGESYEGEWKKGKKNGRGEYHILNNGKDSLITGIWEMGVYKGKERIKPQIIQNFNIDKYQIHEVNIYQNRVLFDFRQNGARNISIENLKLISNNGTTSQSGSLVGFENIIFPVTIKVRYTTYNKLHTQKVNAVFEITIFEPGDYRIDLFN